MNQVLNIIFQQAQQALNEVVEMDKALNQTLKMVDLKETLIIVTADHGHTMSIGGYQARGSDIVGLVKESDGSNTLADDDKPYMILSYANGKGFNDHLNVNENNTVDRLDPTYQDYKNFQFHNPAPVPMKSETHSAADVGIFAKGILLRLF